MIMNITGMTITAAGGYLQDRLRGFQMHIISQISKDGYYHHCWGPSSRPPQRVPGPYHMITSSSGLSKV